jgi:hypothetical protein
MLLEALTLTLQAVTAVQGQVISDTANAQLRHPERIPPTITAVRVQRSPQLDARLDDPAWADAHFVGGFTQAQPLDGAQPTQHTEVGVVYDGGSLYIGARLVDSDPGSIARRLGRRDAQTSSDQFWVTIDSYHDHRTASHFGVNPAGVKIDGTSANDDNTRDDSWDPVWSVATSVDSIGWVVEMKIRFSQLRFSGADEQIWGINFFRLIFRENEWLAWSWVPNEEQGFASHFGHLVGIDGVSAPRGLELLPYTVAKGLYTEGADSLNPFNDGSTYDVAPGLDLKYGVTSELTLDATVNPDFGQVEADPAVVNLSAFETFFPERRPFFVEGANIFQFGAGTGGVVFGAPQLFYSRRIGGRPSVPVIDRDAHYVDYPINTRILAAAKLSGKTRGWSLGVMDALTAREHASIHRQDGTRVNQPVEPLANYTVVSVRRDLRQGATGLGFLGTSVLRDISDSVFQAMRSSAWTGGVDLFHRFGGHQFAINGSFAVSHIRGNPMAMTVAQRSSARYYQRPDQAYVSVDTAATSLTGYGGSLEIAKTAGNWLYGVNSFVNSPGFELNDAGFHPMVDRVFMGARLQRRWLDPGRVFRNFSVSTTFLHQWNFGGTLLSRGPELILNGQFHNYWQFMIGGTFQFKAQSDRDTRGGPLMESPQLWTVYGFANTDMRKRLAISLFGSSVTNVYGGWQRSASLGVFAQAGDAVSFSVQPGYTQSRSVAFYVTQRSDERAAATYGGRYVFGALKQRILNVTMRANLSITPNLSFQLWAQPFVAVGDYDQFKELAAPGTFAFLHYGLDGGSTIAFDPNTDTYTVDPDGSGPAEAFTFHNPDFCVRSLRANLVLRWEYRPGSVLFLVWNHARSGFSSDPLVNVFDELGGLWHDNQQNTFLVKISYWISL